jgi:hypothetical protein
MQQKSLRSLPLSLCTLFALAVVTPGCDQLDHEDFRFNATGPCGDGGTDGGSESGTGGLDESSGGGDGDGDGDPVQQVCGTTDATYFYLTWDSECAQGTVHYCTAWTYSNNGTMSICCDSASSLCSYTKPGSVCADGLIHTCDKV